MNHHDSQKRVDPDFERKIRKVKPYSGPGREYPVQTAALDLVARQRVNAEIIPIRPKVVERRGS